MLQQLERKHKWLCDELLVAAGVLRAPMRSHQHSRQCNTTHSTDATLGIPSTSWQKWQKEDWHTHAMCSSKLTST
jgi:hypothetical protein